MVSIATNATKPDRNIVDEYEKNLRKYAEKEFSLEELARLRRVVFSLSADELSDLNSADEVIFNQQLREIHQELLQKEADMVASYHSMIEDTELKLSESNEMQNEALKVIKSNEKRIINLGSEIVDLRAELAKEIDSKKIDKERIESDIKIFKADVIKINDRVFKAKKIAYLFTVIATFAFLVYVIFLLNQDWQNWDIIEPVIGILGIVVFGVSGVIAYINICRDKHIPNLVELVGLIYKKILIKIYKDPSTKMEKSEEILHRLEKRIKEIEMQIS